MKNLALYFVCLFLKFYFSSNSFILYFAKILIYNGLETLKTTTGSLPQIDGKAPGKKICVERARGDNGRENQRAERSIRRQLVL